MSLAHEPLRVRHAVALNLDLAHGRHGATARLELYEEVRAGDLVWIAD